MDRRIFLSTPLHNEIDNIDRLFKSVIAQDYPIAIWVIVENGSTDGSREDLASRAKPDNVEQLIILNEDTESGEYALGAKYARIVNRGFEEIKSRTTINDEDLIGILDADSFPDPNYYSVLVKAFDDDQKLGIASGASVDEGDGQKSIHASDWVRGSCRLWRGACMNEAGYLIGPSADTLSLGKAVLKGWSARVIEGTIFRAREVGTRSKQRYYGSSAYFRGNTFPYAMLRLLKFTLHGRFADGKDYVGGYLDAMREGKPRLDDLELRAYFQTYIRRKIAKRFKTLSLANS